MLVPDSLGEMTAVSQMVKCFRCLIGAKVQPNADSSVECHCVEEPQHQESAPASCSMIDNSPTFLLLATLSICENSFEIDEAYFISSFRGDLTSCTLFDYRQREK